MSNTENLSRHDVGFDVVRGVDSFVATGDPLLTSISNLRKEKKERKSTVHVQGVPYIAQGLTLENN
jgi:hypothetical protein